MPQNVRVKPCFFKPHFDPTSSSRKYQQSSPLPFIPLPSTKMPFRSAGLRVFHKKSFNYQPEAPVFDGVFYIKPMRSKNSLPRKFQNFPLIQSVPISGGYVKRKFGNKGQLVVFRLRGAAAADKIPTAGPKLRAASVSSV